MDNNSDFLIKLYGWHKVIDRDLPWKDTKDPYKIWLSEIILQQTRVAQGRPYYLKFIEHFPTVYNLAAADLDDVLLLWQGLGYYSRARNMHLTAKRIVEEFEGKFPENYKDVVSLKGIGDYTASAILSFAFDKPYPVLDGNVKRVMARYFNVTEPIDLSPTIKILKTLLAQVFDNKNPARFNQAIMDFGAIQCTPKNPDCQSCPFSSSCGAKLKNSVSILPAKSSKIRKTDRYLHYFMFGTDSIILKKRQAGDIWQGLYDFPLIERKDPELLQIIDMLDFASSFYEDLDPNSFSVRKVLEKKHILTHQNLYVSVYKIDLPFGDTELFYPYIIVPVDLLDRYAFPVVFQDLIDSN